MLQISEKSVRWMKFCSKQKIVEKGVSNPSLKYDLRWIVLDDVI